MRRKLGTLVLCAAACGAGAVSAADWIMVQGAEPPNAKSRFFGAVAITYANHLGCSRYEGLAAPNGTPTGNPDGGPGLNNGDYANNCRVGPELDNTNDGVNVDTLVLGSRGPIRDSKVNYFLAANFGQNAATYQPLKTSRERMGSLTDASLTFNYLPGARVRLGLFQKPGPEEMMEPIVAKDFVFGTDFVTRDQVERFVEGTAKGVKPIAGQGYEGSISTFAYDADLGRDWGIQLFDAFKTGDWTHTYAAMLANGNGIHQADNNVEKDLNLFVSSIYDLPGGKGPDKHGIKFYGYHQRGIRNFIIDDQGSKSDDFERVRYGVGVHALGRFFGEEGHKHRAGLDLMFAEGMVLQSATTSCTDCAYGGQIQIAAEKENKARGISAEYGFYLNKNWQFDARYARNDLLYETVDNGVWTDSDERIITELTLGATYHFTPKTRLTVNYMFRESEAPNPVQPTGTTDAAINNALVQTSNAEQTTGSIGDAFGVRILHMF